MFKIRSICAYQTLFLLLLITERLNQSAAIILQKMLNNLRTPRSHSSITHQEDLFHRTPLTAFDVLKKQQLSYLQLRLWHQNENQQSWRNFQSKTLRCLQYFYGNKTFSIDHSITSLSTNLVATLIIYFQAFTLFPGIIFKYFDKDNIILA